MMRTILITYGCLSCLFSAGYGEENQPTVSDIPSCGILEAGKQTEIAALEQAAERASPMPPRGYLCPWRKNP